MVESKSERKLPAGTNRRTILRALTISSLSILAACSPQSGDRTTSGLAVPSRLPATPIQPTKSVQTPDRIAALRESNRQANRALTDIPLLADQDFHNITKALGGSASPFLAMISNFLEQIWTLEDNPPAFPTWINEASTPMAITHNNGAASFFAGDFSGSDETNRYKMVLPTGKESLYPKPDSVILGINLAFNTASDLSPNQTPLAEGFYLGKEWINTVGLIPSVKDLVPFYTTQGYRFISLSTNQPVKGADIEYAGLSVYYNETLGKTSQLAIIVDGFPVALLATQIESIVRKKYLPISSHTMSGFYAVSNMFKKPEWVGVNERLTNFADTWVKSGNMVPPNDYLTLMLDPKIAGFVLELQKEIINTFPTPTVTH